jgi:phospholipid/cholesterol/gamma-HCH transport system ATP-binding protein
MQDNLVDIKKLHFAHNGRVVFEGVDIAVARGKITAIMGPSGSGKTTLLRLIGALLAPDAGVVSVNGKNIHQLSMKALYQVRRKMGLLL